MKVFQFLLWRPTQFKHHFNKTYQALSSASVDTLWQVLVDLADVSWHPLLNSTNAPRGLTAKPGLMYRAMPRWFPFPIQIFVEQVSHHELLSVRMFPVPGLEERIIYQLESTVLGGTQISYSIMMRGWLSPVAWSVLRPYAAQMASAIAQAAEQGVQNSEFRIRNLE